MQKFSDGRKRPQNAVRKSMTADNTKPLNCSAVVQNDTKKQNMKYRFRNLEDTVGNQD